MRIPAFLIEMPGTSEWVFIALCLLLFIIIPALAYIIHKKITGLKKENQELKDQLRRDQ